MISTIRVIGMLCLTAAVLMLGTIPSSADQKDPYVLAVIPSGPPVATHALWTPFVERLSRDTGIPLRLKVYEKMSDFENDILRGVPDFIFASPFQAVIAHEKQGYIPLVHSSKLVSAELFVRSDSPIRTVNDLSGKTIAFVGNKNL